MVKESSDLTYQEVFTAETNSDIKNYEIDINIHTCVEMSSVEEVHVASPGVASEEKQDDVVEGDTPK